MAQTDERELLETRDAILAVDEDERDLGTLIEVTNDLGGFYRHRSRLEESCQNFDMALDAAEFPEARGRGTVWVEIDRHDAVENRRDIGARFWPGED